MQKLGTDAVYFSPIFESDYHGYDTRDYRVIDKRIGTNKNFAELVSKLHEAGIKVVIDGVFNHVGRGFMVEHYMEDTEPERDTDYYYIRVRQRDQQWAWSSPIWVERT